MCSIVSGDGFSFKQRDRDGVVANRHAVVEFELFPATQSAFEPLRTLLRIAYSQAKVADSPSSKGTFIWIARPVADYSET
jgi:hypothetical protein